MNIIDINQIRKIYKLGKTEVVALSGVDLSIKEKSFISIIGPSGSGKTTLLNIIGCIDKPTEGNVKFMGKDIIKLKDNDLSAMRNREIGFIFQTFNLIPVFSAFENIEYPLIIAKIPREERKKRVKLMLEEVGIAEFSKHKPSELSGGQRQRVSIARALVVNPKLVLADEPTANLDSKTGEVIIELMKKMNKEFATTFIFSTHDEKIMKHAREIIHIRDGRIENNKAIGAKKHAKS
jgi:putative ABC transport system ATP-binding protein